MYRKQKTPTEFLLFNKCVGQTVFCYRSDCRRTRWSRPWTRSTCSVKVSTSTPKMSCRNVTMAPPSLINHLYMFSLFIEWPLDQNVSIFVLFWKCKVNVILCYFDFFSSCFLFKLEFTFWFLVVWSNHSLRVFGVTDCGQLVSVISLWSFTALGRVWATDLNTNISFSLYVHILTCVFTNGTGKYDIKHIIPFYYFLCL